MRIEELVATRGFEGVAALLWDGYAEGGGDEAAVREGMAAARVRAFAEVPKLLRRTRGLNPVEALRVGIGMLPDSEHDAASLPGLRRHAGVPGGAAQCREGHGAARAGSGADARRRTCCA